MTRKALILIPVVLLIFQGCALMDAINRTMGIDRSQTVFVADAWKAGEVAGDEMFGPTRIPNEKYNELQGSHVRDALKREIRAITGATDETEPYTTVRLARNLRLAGMKDADTEKICNHILTMQKESLNQKSVVADRDKTQSYLFSLVVSLSAYMERTDTIDQMREEMGFSRWR